MNIPFKALWTISNMLSISRMLLAPFMYVFIISDFPRSWVYGLALIAYVSDLLDGYMARSRNEITEWGKILDPIADKLFVGSTCLALMTTDNLSVWYIALVIGRDVLIVLAGLFFANKVQVVLPSTFIGKATVFWIGLVLLGAFFQVESNIQVVLYAISTGLIVFSLIHYGKRMFISMRNS
ncbi:MAG: CDP-alcohol phosphatidyltransferase family protein [Ignavibacteria bacterium]